MAGGAATQNSACVFVAGALLDSFSASLAALLAPAADFAAPRLAVAVSGGADSMALTLLAHRWATQRNGCVIALTVDHGLRAESRHEADQVTAWLQAYGIEHHILTPAHTQQFNNLQEAARTWRYDALAKFCHTHGILHCLIAHHKGDNRETVALMLARGDTADGASGMSAVRNYCGVRFLRPLLMTEKSALVELLSHNDLTWIDDPSNANEDFARVRMRNQLAADSERRDELDRLIAKEGPARAAREQAQAAIAAQCVVIDPAGWATIHYATWCSLEPAVASGLLADMLTTIGGKTRRPRAHETLRLVEALHGPTKKRTLHGCEISLHGDVIRITRERAREAPTPFADGFAPPKPLAAAPFWWLK